MITPKGQTLTSLFNLGFGNKLSSMTDRIRDKKRDDLQNLKLVIIDEYSMVKSDMLYQIDQRLKEIKTCPQEQFGGVSVMLLGNLLQLQPVRGRYIFEEPACDNYKFGHHLQSLWELFVPIKLTYNHRQQGEGEFAELLKRIARGLKNEDDLQLLRSRVFPENDERIPKDTLYVFPRKKMVREYNEKMLNNVEGQLEVLQATNIISTRKTFDPYVDEADGKVRGTALTIVLYLKKEMKVVLIHNLDVNDSLNNGAKGRILDFIRSGNNVTHVVDKLSTNVAGRVQFIYKNL